MALVDSAQAQEPPWLTLQGMAAVSANTGDSTEHPTRGIAYQKVVWSLRPGWCCKHQVLRNRRS